MSFFFSSVFRFLIWRWGTKHFRPHISLYKVVLLLNSSDIFLTKQTNSSNGTQMETLWNSENNQNIFNFENWMRQKLRILLICAFYKCLLPPKNAPCFKIVEGDFWLRLLKRFSWRLQIFKLLEYFWAPLWNQRVKTPPRNKEHISKPNSSSYQQICKKTRKTPRQQKIYLGLFGRFWDFDDSYKNVSVLAQARIFFCSKLSYIDNSFYSNGSRTKYCFNANSQCIIFNKSKLIGLMLWGFWLVLKFNFGTS